MQVKQLMRRDVRTCRPDDGLDLAIQRMWEADCGWLPVVDAASGRLVGTLTDRDICMAAHVRACPPHALRAEEVMARGVRTVRQAEVLADAAAIMGDAQVRRLPVVDRADRLVGVISLADLALEAERACRSRRPPITQQEIGDTLAAICAPRRRQPFAAQELRHPSHH